jgi:hypothetical protein
LFCGSCLGRFRETRHAPNLGTKLGPNMFSAFKRSIVRPINYCCTHSRVTTEFAFCIASNIDLVSSCPPRWPTHRLIIFKSQPFLATLEQGACRATSCSLCSLSTRRRVQFSTQLQPRGHRERSTHRGPNTNNVGLPSARERYGRSTSCCCVDILSSFCTIFTG